jgi:hypothetical protein
MVLVSAMILAWAITWGAGWSSPGVQGSFTRGWLAAGAILLPLLALLWFAWRRAGGGKMLAWMLAAALGVRLVAGLLIPWALVHYGYEEPCQKVGYVFYDSCQRDQAAWELAQSDRALGQAFNQQFAADQYGGLLSLSAWIYRTLSPDAHRPYLVVLLAAGAAALGIPFLWDALRRRWGEKAAHAAGWLAALYPESVLLGSAQMREPFLIALGMVILWAVLAWPEKDGRWQKAWGAVAFVIGSLLMVLLSYRAALPVMGVALAWFFIQQAAARGTAAWQKLAWVVLAAAGLAAVILGWGWLRVVVKWDTYLAVLQSGMLEYILDSLPQFLRIPFVVAYGLLQPVLPAALVEPAPAVWQTLAILRALGWYMLLPVLVYASLALYRARPAEVRRLLIWLALAVWVWLIVSSARAGGDQWDNPRYRTIFLPWMALLAGWGWQWARAQRDPLLGRILGVEVIFMLFFGEWYLSRLIPALPHPSFLVVSGLIIAASMLFLAGSWAYNRYRRSRG